MSKLYNLREGIGQTTQRDPKTLKILKESKEKQKERNENKLAKGTMPARNKKNFRSTKSGAGMTRAGGGVAEAARKLRAQGLMGGGMAMPRAMYGKGGGVCKRGMNRQAIGKNS